MSEERVQKLMAQANIGSRRACEKMIEQGRVRVNGNVIELGAKANPAKDKIQVDDETLRFENIELVYYVLNKPTNVLSTNTPNHEDDREIVRNLIPVEGHLFTIGRLDAESEGLMVLTNDGDLTNKLSHPRYEHTKTYKVTVYGTPDADTIEKWQEGIWMDGARTSACYVKVLESNKSTSVLRVVMIEGKKRQIRRVASQLGHPVKKLMRTHIGQLGIGTLRRGEWYQLSEQEVAFMSEPAWELSLIRKRRQARKRKNSQK